MPSALAINAAHLHLILNHVPTVGMAVALGILLIALFRRDDTLKHVGLEVLFVIAVVTLPVYTSGVAAQRQLGDVAELTDYAIRVHQDAALWGFVIAELAGFAAWVALWQLRRHGRALSATMATVVVLSIASLAVMGRAANLGGEIGHPEIVTVSAAEAARALGGREQFIASQITQLMTMSTWVWPTAEAIHFLGLCLTFGILLAVNLRILGVMKQVAFADVHRLLPWGMLGFGANIITGMLFFVGQPGQYVNSAPFHWKLVFLMIAGANFLYVTVFHKGWTGGMQSNVADKAMAVTSLVSWLGVLYAGRMLPFLGDAF